MDHITVQQAAEKWNISDRRVRVLCSEGKIPGVVKAGKSYKIPLNAAKPADGRKKNPSSVNKSRRFLKWANDIVGIIDESNMVTFTDPEYNKVVAMYTCGKKVWAPEQFTEFLSERIVSRDRRDIERILFRCGLSHYDALQIADITRGIHPKDLLWVAHGENETLDTVVTEVFSSVFHQRIDLTGDSLDTPEGYNIKRYGAYGGRYGIFKQRISPLATDVESELAVYLLALRMGVPCCPADRVDVDTIFSTFLFDFSKEYIIHFRRLFDGQRSDNEYRNLIEVRPAFKDELSQMILLDFVTRQDDRHLSNMAIKIKGKSESFYPLYDNGRSLFYEDTEETVVNAVSDPVKYATSFGYSGTYFDYVQEISDDRGGLKGLVNLEITDDEIASILTKSGFSGYRFHGALGWIAKTLKLLQTL